MRRAFVVAGVEFRAFVRARSFLLGILLPPLIGAFGGFAAWAARPDREPGPAPSSRIAIVDRSGSLFGALEIAAARRNAGLDERGVRFELERVEPEHGAIALEDRVRAGDLQAAVEIPAEAAADSGEPVRVRVVGRQAVRDEIGTWIARTVREELRTRALRSAGVSSELRARLERRVLADVGAPAPAEGEASGAAPDPRAAPAPTRLLLERLGPAQKLVIAGPLAFILFFAVSIAAAPLFQSVLEEKTSRVSEILVSSVTPFELMLGKLLGSLAACGIAAAIYVGLLLAVMVLVLGAALPAALLGLFLLYLVLSLLLWGALFLTIGAACTDMKDAQNLMVPVVLVQVLPLLFLSNVTAAPSGALARVLSLLPPTAPLAMLIRLGFEPAPHVAEVALSVALLAVAAVACVWAAGRVLRVGLLAQGRSASLRQIARWVWSG